MKQQKEIESVNLDNSPTLGITNYTYSAPNRHLDNNEEIIFIPWQHLLSN